MQRLKPSSDQIIHSALEEKIPVGLTALKQYPQAELYRLIVDGRLHKNEKGWVEYEKREPGSIKAAFNGLALAITNINDTILTTNFIEKLHLSCTRNVRGLESKDSGRLRVKPMQDLVGFYIEPENATEEGILELLNMIESQKDFQKYHSAWIGYSPSVGQTDFETAIYHHSLQKMRAYYGLENNEQLSKHLLPMFKRREYAYLPPRPGEAFNKELKSIIKTYNSTIVEAKDEESKLEDIVNIISDLNHLHPFMDANIRTFAILLLNRLLIQNKFFPATFYNPNCFDAHSKKEMIAIIKQSMQNTKDILNGKKDIFEFNSSEIPKEYQSQYMDIISEFISTVEKVSNTKNQTIKMEHDQGEIKLIPAIGKNSLSSEKDIEQQVMVSLSLHPNSIVNNMSSSEKDKTIITEELPIKNKIIR